MAGLDLIFNGEELVGDLGFDYNAEHGDNVPSLVRPVWDNLDNETEDLLSNVDAELDGCWRSHCRLRGEPWRRCLSPHLSTATLKDLLSNFNTQQS